jgi:predicted glutamine amidotransferase
MSHLVAYFGNEPENLACALFFARNALYTHDHVEGWALGFVQGGDVLLQKRPRANTAEVDFYTLSRNLNADALIGRVGLGKEGNRSAENADPFRYRAWLFGAVGHIPKFELVRERMLESTPDFLRRNIRGHSAGEHLFHLFLANLHTAGLLDVPTPNPGRVNEALLQALGTLGELLEQAQAGAPASSGSSVAVAHGHSTALTAVVTNGRCLVAANHGHAAQFLRVDGIADCPVCHDRVHGDGHAHAKGRRIAHEALRAIILEADARTQGRAGWRPVPDGTSLVAGPDRVPHLVSATGAGAT